MKTVLRIFGVIVILIALLTGAMSIWRANRDKDDLRESQTQMAQAKEQLALLKDEVKNMTGESKVQMDEQIAAVEEGMETLPSESTYIIVQVLLGALLVLALAFGVFLFRPDLKLSTMLLGVSVVLLLAAYFISPDLKRGEYSGLPSRTLALLAGIPVVLAGFFAFLVAKKTVVKAN